jgi:hypothetical protein
MFAMIWLHAVSDGDPGHWRCRNDVSRRQFGGNAHSLITSRQQLKIPSITTTMTQLSEDQWSQFHPLDLSDISPATVSSTSALHSVITVKWPYMSSTQKLTFLLADPLRIHRNERWEGKEKSLSMGLRQRY